MKKIAACLLIATLAACDSSEPEPAPTPTASVAAPEPEPSLPAPDEATFAATFAKACPNAPKVTTSICKSRGFGKEGFICDYGFGDDDRHPHKATLMPGEDKWIVTEPEKTCAADAA